MTIFDQLADERAKRMAHEVEIKKLRRQVAEEDKAVDLVCDECKELLGKLGVQQLEITMLEKKLEEVCQNKD